MIERLLLRVTVACMFGLCVMLGRALAEPDTVRTLAQSCAAEATWLERDCRAILHTLKRRADRADISIASHARDYVSAFKTGLPARRWVLEIEETCSRPPSWPAHLDWEAHRYQCVLLFERVRAFVAGDSIDPCRGRAWHWGSRELTPDVERARRARWESVDCGTRNAFYSERTVEAAEAKGGNR
jgi:hypothetical protein